MKTLGIVAAITAVCTALPAVAQNKKSDARGQLNQANQSGRTFDGNRSSSGNSTLNQRDAVVAKPAAKPNRTQEQAIQDYRNSGRADPTPQSMRRTSPPPPSPTTSSSSSSSSSKKR